MVLKSSFKFFWLIFLSLPFSQENIRENAEDFIQSYFEPEEFYSADYVQRIRIIPNGNNENWQQKIRLENDRFKMGWRIDKSSYAEFFQNRKEYLSVQAKDYNIIIGNAPIQTGNSLLFGWVNFVCYPITGKRFPDVLPPDLGKHQMKRGF